MQHAIKHKQEPETPTGSLAMPRGERENPRLKTRKLPIQDQKDNLMARNKSTGKNNKIGRTY